MKKISIKISVLFLLIIIISIFIIFDLNQYFSLTFAKENLQAFLIFFKEHKIQSYLIYFFIYLFSTALSLPGAAALTLVGGAIFGLLHGTILVSFASTFGASLAFIFSRFLFRETIENKFKKKIEIVNEGLKKDGALYLFTLRLIPLFPFWMINLLMGITKIKLQTFFIVSQLGMLPGTLAYVYAGRQLGQINSINDVLSVKLMLAFTILGILPLLSKKIIELIKNRRVYKPYKKPKKFDYNMIVIGAGSGGLVTAYISATVKAKVLLVEMNKMGGDCLNTGCVPSKALLRSAKIANLQKRAIDYGFKSLKLDYEFSDVMERVQKIIKKVEPHDSVSRYLELGVECLAGEAKIISPWEVEVSGNVFRTKNITIATGATPAIPNLSGLDKVGYKTSDTIWEIRERPEKLLVVGGGPIGVELAQAFQRLGCQVYLIQRPDHLLVKEDPDVSSFVRQRLEAEGVKVYCKTRDLRFELSANGKEAIFFDQSGEIRLFFNELLIALGRKANVSDLGLDKLGVNLRANGTIDVNEYLQTNYPNVFAVGDVTGPYQLTHMAAHQAWYAAINGLFGLLKKFKVDYSVVPWCTYIDPEVATVGLTEQEAKRKKIIYELTRYDLDDLDRSIADGENYGFIKVLTIPNKDIILGATIVGSNASSMILEFISAMKNGFGLNKILTTIHIYPSVGEANKFLAGNWKKNHTPSKLLSYAKKFHAFNR